MTDEEMAEQFADNISGLELTCSVLASKDKNHAYRLGRYDGFLAGLKAGRPQWHEIESKVSPKREISKKYMPKNKEKVLLKYHFYDDNEIHISDGYYDAYDFQFHIANNPKFRIVCVIAWCELPKYI